ncbi:MAG: hypothetical protein QFX37_05025 [Archaeoglobales archaeon]|nr:hypothetical protein [Archaeoglobales archaeon]
MQFRQTKLNQDEEERKVKILFRNSVPEIPSTTYATFAIYKYPAKFIPQVIAYVLKKYANPKMKVFDPFAGYGTTGVVARVYGNDYEIWDLNPIIKVLHDTATSKQIDINLYEFISEIKKCSSEFLPRWSNLEYWFPEEFIEVLSKSWGHAHELEGELKYALLVPLMKVTKYFSYADEKVHKLYRSKYSKKKVTELLKSNWKEKFYSMLEEEIRILLKKIVEYNRMKPKDVNFEVRAGIDTLETKLEKEADLLITSPPYLQAQEYIRSTKLELFWLGYSEEFIRNLSEKEIPYRKINKIEVRSPTFHEFRDRIKEEHLLKLYDQYFYAILGAFEKLGEKIEDFMCIFVGQAKIRTMKVPIDEIIVEHLTELGWKHEITYIDQIVARVMFESPVNPASGIRDSRMKTEHLVVLRK